MTGVQRPTIFKFIDSLLIDESIARAKMLNCDAGQDASKAKKKDIDRDKALKKIVIGVSKGKLEEF